jgi:SP family myo-inositol transporter-like MFS transporter 13
MGGFLFGYDTGIVAGAQLYFADEDGGFPELATDEGEKGLIVSLAQLGAFFGALMAGPLSDKFGRKPVILAADLLFAAGSVLMYVAPSVAVLMAGRIVVGVGVGLASLIVPVYLSEASPTEVRGAVVAIDVMIITAGQFLSSLISLALGRNWRLMLGIGAVPAILQFVGMLFLPES